ncbi:hypothetical protein BGZ75_009099 [Mortierella antarctica]|nr:hypothetical protein BGZ75_009099 [Mortierella antarctica]
MDVPEIRAMVALHMCRSTFYDLARHDLTVCVRVCRDWHATFMPLLYYFLSLRISHTSRNRKPTPVPPLEVLEANSHLFQELYLALFSTRSPILQHAVATLRNLKRLGLRAMYMREEADEIDWLALRPLLTNNIGIQELSIANIKHPDCLAHVAESCTSHLTSLVLVFASLSGHFDSLAYLDITVQPTIEQWMVKRILEGCPRLVELYLCDMDTERLYGTALDDQEDLPWASRDSLKTLWMNDIQVSLDGSVNDRFMKQLRNLKQLEKLSIKDIYIEYGARGILDVYDVPGNTPEALLLSDMCKFREHGISNPDLRDPMMGWLREAWPRLLHFEYVMSDDNDDNYSE